MAAPSQAKTERGRDLWYDDLGYEYVYYRTAANGEIFYRCSNHSCKGKAHFVNGTLTKYADHDNDRPHPTHKEEIRLVKQRVVEDRQHGVPTAVAIQRNVLNAPSHLLPLLNPSNLAKTARRSVEIHGQKEWPATLDPTQFNPPFARADTCILYPKGDPQAFKLMFSDFGINLLRTHSEWSIDGTFYAAPVDFVQILVIGIQQGHLFTPCVYAFLASKTHSAYENVFRWLKVHGNVNSPTTVTSDFEIGLTKGLLEVYPTASIYRCAFHLYQNVFRKIQELGLTQLYRDAATQPHFKGIMALSMLPPADIPSYFDKLKHRASNSVPRNMIAKTEALFNYFEKTYIGVRGVTGARVNPMYPMDTWSIHARILAKHQIGNSTIEGFNSKLKSVPAGSSAQKVATILADIDRSYESHHEYARVNNLSLMQAFPQNPQSSNTQSRRFYAVSNGAMGETCFNHLKALTNHIHDF